MRVAAIVVLVVAQAGCGGGTDGGTDGDDAVDQTTAPTTTAPSEAETTTTIDAEGISELEALAPELLIITSELPVAGLQDVGYTPPGSLPSCDFVLDDEVPPDLHVGTSLGAPQNVPFVTEAIRVYLDAPTATAAYEAAVANEAPCRLAYQAFTGPTDVNDRIGADRAVSFAMLDRGGSTEVFHVLLGDALVSFEVRPWADSPAAVDVAAFGVGKILAALET